MIPAHVTNAICKRLEVISLSFVWNHLHGYVKTTVEEFPKDRFTRITYKCPTCRYKMMIIIRRTK